MAKQSATEVELAMIAERNKQRAVEARLKMGARYCLHPANRPAKTPFMGILSKPAYPLFETNRNDHRSKESSSQEGSRQEGAHQ